MRSNSSGKREPAGYGSPFSPSGIGMSKPVMNLRQEAVQLKSITSSSARGSGVQFLGMTDSTTSELVSSKVKAVQKNMLPVTTPRRLDVLTQSNNVLRESSMIFMSKLHFKPFNYGRFNEKLNVNLLENTDIDAIELNGDIASSSKILRNIAFTDFNVDLIENMGYANFQRIFRLWQLSIAEYGDRQRTEQTRGENLYSTYRSCLDASQKIDGIKKTHAEKKSKLNEVITSITKQIALLKETSARQAKYKCTYCDLTFASKKETETHIDDKHKGVVDEIKKDKKIFEDLGNPARNITRREERIIEDTNQIIAERVAKEVEEKMGEQLRRLLEKQEDLKKTRDIAGTILAIQESETHSSENTDQQQLQLVNSVQKMNSVFSGFEEMFTQMQAKQHSMISEQVMYTKRLQEIEADQRRLEEEKEQQRLDMIEQLRTIHEKQALLKEASGAARNDEDNSKEEGQDNFLQTGLMNFENNNLRENNYNEENQNSFARQNGFGGGGFGSKMRSPEENGQYGGFVQSHASPQQQQGLQAVPNSLYGTSDVIGVSRRSDLKRQFKDKYGSEERVEVAERKRLKKLLHLGDLESDFDSDLMEEALEEEIDDNSIAVLVPTNRHKQLREAELSFKEMLFTEKELNDIQKNLAFKMAVVRKEAKAAAFVDRVSKTSAQSHFYETNDGLSNFPSAEQERRKNERLIQEVISMNEKRMVAEELNHNYEGADVQLIQQRSDIAAMKKKFIQDQLKFKLEDNEADVMELDEQKFHELKIKFNDKFTNYS